MVPQASKDLPGTGGRLGTEAEDFQVIEIPAYLPSGEGSHCYLRLRKRGLTTFDAVRSLAEALGVAPRDVGTAGLKDKWAVTEQWVSVPGVSPAAALALAVPGIEVLEARCHGNKLKTGHLKGNRFVLRLVDVGPEALQRAQAILAWLTERGFHHAFGPQRFGRGGSTARAGRDLLLGRAGPRDPRQRRLVVSAIQAELFNDYLRRRIQAGPLTEPFTGEVCQRTDSGGAFVAEDLDEVRARFIASAVVPSGPLYGPRMTRSPVGSVTRELEEAVLADAGLVAEDFAAVKQIAPGGRRPLLVRPLDWSAVATETGIEVGFTLPAGAYATILLRELTKTPEDSTSTAPDLAHEEGFD
jgi:tRNA pseudouridine13 synthase